ncbi:MAG: alpha/beta hydrolase [Myxococcota bacterium]
MIIAHQIWEYGETADMATLEIDGHPFHYVAEGSGSPSIVFIHGYSCSHTDWQHQATHFAPNHRVVSVDLRGHGQSNGYTSGFNIETCGADICALLEALELAPAVLVGHSLGCRVVMEAASERPDLVAGTIMVDGSRSAEGDRQAAEFHANDMVEEAGGIAKLRPPLFEAMFTEKTDKALQTAVLERAAAVAEDASLELWVSMQGYDAGTMEGALSGIEGPMLIIQSTDRDPDYAGRVTLKPGDTTTWTELADRVVSEVRTEIVADTGHFTMLDAPGETNALIEKFLGELSS